MISNLVVDTIFWERNHRITQWNDTLLNPALPEMYAHAIQKNGSPLRNCFSFRGGTLQLICQPDLYERIVYNGHKGVHGLKYQYVAVANMYGQVGNFTIEVINLFG